jgi:hypothetical protein
MEAIVMLIVLILGLAALDVTSIVSGADSRDPIPDDHRR